MRGEIFLENQKLQAKKTFKSIGYALFTMIVLVMVSQVILIAVLNQLVPGIEKSPWYIGILVGVPFYLVGTPIFLWMMRKLPDGPKGEAKKLSIKQIVIAFFISMAASYIFNLVGIIINLLIGMIKGSDILNPLETIGEGTGIIPTIIFIGILSPIIEEVVFRGVLLDKLRGHGERRAIFFTALSFALFHGNLSQFFYAFALGLIFAYITLRTNTIRYAVLLHILVNIFGSVIMPNLALSGNEILMILGGLIVIAFIVVGSLLFSSHFKKIKLEDKKDEFDKRLSKRFAYGNPGMILYYIMCSLLFIITIIS